MAPRTTDINLRRKAVYRTRQAISRWSHRMFWLARRLHHPGLYRVWARASLRLYQALAYSGGPLGALFDRLLGANNTEAADISTAGKAPGR